MGVVSVVGDEIGGNRHDDQAGNPVQDMVRQDGGTQAAGLDRRAIVVGSLGGAECHFGWEIKMIVVKGEFLEVLKEYVGIQEVEVWLSFKFVSDDGKKKNRSLVPPLIRTNGKGDV
jgi:hypothetical protein